MQSLKQVSLNTETSHPVKVLWAPRSVGRYAVINALSAALLLSAACHAATFTIDSPECVQDTALWNREFSGWNFGGSPLLEVGSVPGLYEEHRSVSLIRFDLSGLACETIEGATLRLYKPNSFVQRSPVEGQVYEVSAANANWKEGRMEAAPDSNGASWDFLRHDTPWTGGSGLAVEKEAYKSPALAVRTAPHDRGVWLEFQLPAELVQRWLEHPGLNSGLLIKTGDEAEWGEHAHFYASEHHSGNGPQLVLRGTPGSPRAGRTPAAGNLRHMFPREDDPQFLRWLKEADSRYTQWVREYKMTPAQALYIYYYDVIVRGEMLMPRVRIPMFQTLLETEQRIAAGDEAGVREKLNDIRELMLIWEYIRQTQWYDSGPLAEALSPLQLAWLYAKPKSGIFSGIDESGQSWRLLTPAQLDRTVRSRLDRKSVV